MFIIELRSAKAARKMSWLMAVGSVLGLFFINAGLGLLLTMHFYIKPSERPPHKGLRIFGFQITR